MRANRRCVTAVLGSAVCETSEDSIENYVYDPHNATVYVLYTRLRGGRVLTARSRGRLIRVIIPPDTMVSRMAWRRPLPRRKERCRPDVNGQYLAEPLREAAPELHALCKLATMHTGLGTQRRLKDSMYDDSHSSTRASGRESALVGPPNPVD